MNDTPGDSANNPAEIDSEEVDEDDDDFEDYCENWEPDASITRELFLEWRSPRYGTCNPERMSNPVWEWLVRTRVDAYQPNKHFNGPSAFDAGPGWCCRRFGQSSTTLPDGRVILIAGEHEDSYDPDFHIYNDVIIRHPDGGIEIYGYPEEVFPPTDSHSATLSGDKIIIIGNLSYAQNRQAGIIPVYILDIRTLSISAVETAGSPPGWLHKHKAILSEDGKSITITGGILDSCQEDSSLRENPDDWRLHLDEWRWERLTERKWQQWEVARNDGKCSHLWEVERLTWYKEVNWEKDYEESMQRLLEKTGQVPDLGLVARLYRPEIPHEPLPERKKEHRVHRVQVDGIIVRYVEDLHAVQITIEGNLPQDTIDALTADLLGKFSALENVPCRLKRL